VTVQVLLDLVLANWEIPAKWTQLVTEMPGRVSHPNGPEGSQENGQEE